MQVDWKMRLKVRPILMCWRVPLPVDTPEEAGANSTPTTRGECTVLWGGGGGDGQHLVREKSGPITELRRDWGPNASSLHPFRRCWCFSWSLRATAIQLRVSAHAPVDVCFCPTLEVILPWTGELRVCRHA